MDLTVKQIDEAAPEPGVLQQVASGIYWLQMPLPMALNHINLYLIDDGDVWVLVDTGMDTPDTRQYWEQLFQQHFTDKPLKKIIVTHMHPDHVGLAGWLGETWKCPLYMTQVEYFIARCYSGSESRPWRAEQYYRECGLSDEWVAGMKTRAGFKNIVSTMPSSYIQINDTQKLMIGDDEWQVIVGGGHTAAHASLYCSKRKLLLAGDQILPSISPNVGVMATEPEGSPLHAWYESLERLKSLDPETLVLPAHNKPFYGLHQRADDLIEHHESQLKVILSECQEWTPPLELLKPLFGREIGEYEMSLAMGECKAHLHMLLDRGLIDRELRDGVEHYLSRVSISPDDVEHELRGSLQV